MEKSEENNITPTQKKSNESAPSSTAYNTSYRDSIPIDIADTTSAAANVPNIVSPAVNVGSVIDTSASAPNIASTAVNVGSTPSISVMTGMGNSSATDIGMKIPQVADTVGHVSNTVLVTSTAAIVTQGQDTKSFALENKPALHQKKASTTNIHKEDSRTFGEILYSACKGFLNFLGAMIRFLCGIYSCGSFLEKHRKIIRRCLLMVLLIIMSLIGYWAYNSHLEWVFIRTMRGIVLEGEAWFIQGNYTKAMELYNNALEKIKEPGTRDFLISRQKIVATLLSLQSAIEQSQLATVDEILTQGEKEKWPSEMNAIFMAHCDYFTHPINKLRQYQKNVQEILELLKQGQQENAEKLLLQNIDIAKNTKKSLLPLRSEMLRGVQDGYPAMLQVAWKYREKLQLDTQDFSNALGQTRESQRQNATNMLQSKSLEISKILQQILLPEDNEILAKASLPNINLSLEEQELALETCITLAPHLPDVSVRRGELYRQQKRFAEAQVAYIHAQKNSAAKFFHQSACCALENEDWPQAILIWEQALAFQQEFYPARLQLAMLAGLCSNFSVMDEYLGKISLQPPMSLSSILKSWRRGEKLDMFVLDISCETNVQMASIQVLSAIVQPKDQKEKSIWLLQQAEDKLPENHSKAIILLYRSIVQNNDALITPLQASEKPLEQFCYAMYQKNKNVDVASLIAKLPKNWQELWGKWNLDKFNFIK